MGESAIAAPTHSFKVITNPKETHTYILENGPIEADRDLKTFAVPIIEFEISLLCDVSCINLVSSLVSSLINSSNKFGRFFRLLAHTDLTNFSKFTSI